MTEQEELTQPGAESGFTHEVRQGFLAPFGENETKHLPKATANGKALALPYIDARAAMRRLDEVVGPGGWSFDFDVVDGHGKMVKGRLTVLGVTKCDAGESDKEDETLKSAVSDAIKRCAVHFGIGRYLYLMPQVWAPFDPQKRRFTETPRYNPAHVSRALRICGYEGEVAVAPREIPEYDDGPGTGRPTERPRSPENRPLPLNGSQDAPQAPPTNMPGANERPGALSKEDITEISSMLSKSGVRPEVSARLLKLIHPGQETEKLTLVVTKLPPTVTVKGQEYATVAAVRSLIEKEQAKKAAPKAEGAPQE